MKLSKENRKRQRAIGRTLAAGKGVRGLLASLVAATSALFVSGCRDDIWHVRGRVPMGDYPNPDAETKKAETNKPRETCDSPMPMGRYLEVPTAQAAPKKPEPDK